VGSKEIFALRKQGQHSEALKLARVEYAENEGDIWFLRAYAWSLYDHLKKLVDAYEAKHLAASSLSQQISPYMREFSQMASLLRGDSAFSQVLRLAGKVSRDWEDFLIFAQWAGIDDFSLEDKEPFINDQGKKIDSLQKRFSRAICREVVTSASDPQQDEDLIDWGRNFLNQSLQDDPNDQWLNYYQSKLHLADGEVDQAIYRLAPVLRRQSRAAWTWALLGDILKGTRSDEALTCYSHATQLARDEQEVAKTRIQLAQLLTLEGRFSEAAQQTKLALNYREQHGYKVPAELSQLLASDWYRQAVEGGHFTPLPRAAPAANAILQELDRHSLTYSKGVIDHVNAEKALSYVATSANDGFVLLHSKFPSLTEQQPGTILEVGRAEPDGPPLDWRDSEAITMQGLCEIFSGSVERHEGKSFAFLRGVHEDVFIPPEMASEFSSEQTYSRSCLALCRANKQGKIGWRAVRFLES